MKLIYQIFIVSILFAFTACGGDKTEKAPAADPVAETTTQAETKPATKTKEIPASGTIYTMDVANSEVIWTGDKPVGDKHIGTINLDNGSLIVDAGKITGGSISILMKSIKNTDIKDANYNGKLVGHLTSADFFDVEQYPYATFKITSVADAKEETSNKSVTGDLTIKGITKSITFPMYIEVGEKSFKAAAKMMIDRTDFNVKYNSGKFFQGLGDKLINDKFSLNFTLSGTKSN